MKFKVGQKWLDRSGDIWKITDICNDAGEVYPVYALNEKNSDMDCFTAQGRCLAFHTTEVYLVDLVPTPKFKVGDRIKWTGPSLEGGAPNTGTIVEILPGNRFPYSVQWDNNLYTNYTSEVFLESAKKSDEAQASKLPPEPVPGQYYRTRYNKKMLYVGKGIERWIYQLVNGGIFTYDKPYTYNPTSCEYDIIAPWTEPLLVYKCERCARTWTESPEPYSIP